MNHSPTPRGLPPMTSHRRGLAAPRPSQRGMTLLVILILMTVMLLGALGLARVTEGSTLDSGNVATKEASLQAQPHRRRLDVTTLDRSYWEERWRKPCASTQTRSHS